MELVDEEDEIAVGRRLGDDLDERVLEVAAKLRGRRERAHDELDDAQLADLFRCVVVDRAPREPFDDCGLPDAGVTDEHGVALLLSKERADHLLRLGLASEDGLDSTIARELREILREAIERRRRRMRLAIGRAWRRRRARRRAGLYANVADLLEDVARRDLRLREEALHRVVAVLHERGEHVDRIDLTLGARSVASRLLEEERHTRRHPRRLAIVLTPFARRECAQIAANRVDVDPRLCNAREGIERQLAEHGDEQVNRLDGDRPRLPRRRRRRARRADRETVSAQGASRFG